MKKWLVALLVVLAALVLVLPGIVGLVAERGLQEVVGEAPSDTAEFAVTTERFDRKWFSSAGRHRVELRRGELYLTAAELARGAGEDTVPALIITTELQHGIRPIGGGPGGFLPVLARSESTLQLETASGELIDIPGTLHSEVGLTGTTRSRYLLEAGSHAGDHVRLRWDGADIEFSITPNGSSAKLSGTVEPLSLDSKFTTLRSGPMKIDAEAVNTEYGFRTGSLDLEVAELSIDNGAQPLVAKNLSIRGQSDISRGRLHGDADIHFDTLTVPTLGDSSADLSLRVDGIDAATLRRIYVALDRARRSARRGANAAAFSDFPGDDFLLLLSKGFDLSIDRLELVMPHGTVNGSVLLELPDDDVDEPKGWSSLALQARAAVDLEIDQALMDIAQEAEPNLGSLVALGYLRREGDRYKLLAEVDSGRIVINGAPMSIPMMFD